MNSDDDLLKIREEKVTREIRSKERMKRSEAVQVMREGVAGMKREVANTLRNDATPPQMTLRQIAKTFRKRPNGHMITTVIMMAAQGISAEQISHQTLIKLDSIRSWLREPEVMEKIVALQSRNTVISPKKRFEMLVPQAIDTVAELTQAADKDSVRLAAAQVILDYGMGKPVQRLEVTDQTTLREVVEIIRRKTAHVPEASPTNDIVDAEFTPVAEGAVVESAPAAAAAEDEMKVESTEEWLKNMDV